MAVKGHKGILGVMEMFCLESGLKVAFVRVFKTVRLNFEHSTMCKLYLNKELKDDFKVWVCTARKNDTGVNEMVETVGK